MCCSGDAAESRTLCLKSADLKECCVANGAPHRTKTVSMDSSGEMTHNGCDSSCNLATSGDATQVVSSQCLHECMHECTCACTPLVMLAAGRYVLAYEWRTNIRIARRECLAACTLRGHRLTRRMKMHRLKAGWMMIIGSIQTCPTTPAKISVLMLPSHNTVRHRTKRVQEKKTREGENGRLCMLHNNRSCQNAENDIAKGCT